MTKRICSTCKEEKDLSQFRKDKSSPTGHSYYCLECGRNYNKSSYMNSYGDKSRKRSRDNHIKNKLLLEQYKNSRCCEYCGETHQACLEFHHKDPAEKKYTIARMMTSYVWEHILKEITKCLLLCANCHKKKHWEENKASVA